MPGRHAVGGRPGMIATNRMRGVSGSPMRVGAARPAPSQMQGIPGIPSGRTCATSTYGSPPVVVGPDGCDIGFNGCGDTVSRIEVIAANATQDVIFQAPIEFTPRYALYTGPADTFLVNSIRVANGPDSHFGAGYEIDIYAIIDTFTFRRVSWPTFYNSPGLLVNITNTTAADAQFELVLIGESAHV